MPGIFSKALTAAAMACALANAQQVGTQKSEVHPSLSIQQCSKGNGCTSESASVTLDANWRWTHTTSGYTNCYSGNKWDSSICPDPETCAQNCAVDGADYEADYGISASGNALNIKFVTKNSNGANVGSRTYLMDGDDSYKMFNLLNQEFTFDVDVSNLPCGLNGALYFVNMEKDGGMSKFPSNKAGAKYGTGYCDAQCPRDLKFINGAANMLDWNATSANSGVGKYGSCCVEMDIWEANKISQAYTPHTCSTTQSGQTQCSGSQCGDLSGDRYKGMCDRDGCDFASYRDGDHTFFGPGSSFKVDSTKKMTVVTQFLTSDGTANGDLNEIRRFYVQDGKMINNTMVTIGGSKKYDSVTDKFCADMHDSFNEKNGFADHGGLRQMSDAMKRGMVLVMSLWDDYAVSMLWLDSSYPPERAGQPGVDRGTCPTSSGKPADVEKQYPNSNVVYSNIRYGDIGSTTSASPGPSPSGCPGGSLSACIGLCPSSPPAAYKACVQECAKRC